MTSLRLKKMSVYGFRVNFDVIDSNAKCSDVRTLALPEFVGSGW